MRNPQPPRSSDQEPEPLDVRLHSPIPAVVVVRVSGELNGRSVPLLTERVSQQFARAPHVVIDLADVTFLGAAGLEALKVLHRHATDSGCRVHLAADHEAVCCPPHLAGLDQLLPVVASADALLACLTPARVPLRRATGRWTAGGGSAAAPATVADHDGTERGRAVVPGSRTTIPRASPATHAPTG